MPRSTPLQLNKAFQAEESPGVIYCISMQWFREWEAFVKSKDNDNGEWKCKLAGDGAWLGTGALCPDQKPSPRSADTWARHCFPCRPGLHGTALTVCPHCCCP